MKEESKKSAILAVGHIFECLKELVEYREDLNRKKQDAIKRHEDRANLAIYDKYILVVTHCINLLSDAQKEMNTAFVESKKYNEGFEWQCKYHCMKISELIGNEIGYHKYMMAMLRDFMRYQDLK